MLLLINYSPFFQLLQPEIHFSYSYFHEITFPFILLHDYQIDIYSLILFICKFERHTRVKKLQARMFNEDRRLERFEGTRQSSITQFPRLIGATKVGNERTQTLDPLPKRGISISFQVPFRSPL